MISHYCKISSKLPSSFKQCLKLIASNNKEKEFLDTLLLDLLQQLIHQAKLSDF